MSVFYYCSRCNAELEENQTYEYRGAYSCVGCFDEVIDSRDRQRQEIIEEETAKTEVFRGLDMGDNLIGRGNREILKTRIEVAGKESGRLKEYEGR